MVGGMQLQSIAGPREYVKIIYKSCQIKAAVDSSLLDS